MKDWKVMVAMIAIIVCYVIFIRWFGGNYSYNRDYKDVYEQMRMERMITGRIESGKK